MSTEQLKPVVYLRGERIYLRPLEPGDVHRCQRWINDPDTRLTLGGPFFPVNEKAELAFVEGTAKPDEAIFAIVVSEGNRHIGTCGLRAIHWQNRSAQYGILIGEVDQRGKGFGTEVTRLILDYAFKTLNLNRVELGVLDFNTAGIKAYEKAGFVREGVQRENCFRDGRYRDHLCYAVLARDYFARLELSDPREASS